MCTALRGETPAGCIVAVLYSVEISGRYWHVRNHQNRTIVYLLIFLGVVRLQKRQIESELKVWQNERVPSQFGTRLYGLHGRVQSEAFRFK